MVELGALVALDRETFRLRIVLERGVRTGVRGRIGGVEQTHRSGGLGLSFGVCRFGGLDNLDRGSLGGLLLASAAFDAAARLARLASVDTVSPVTSSITAMGALSPLRLIVLMMRV